MIEVFICCVGCRRVAAEVCCQYTSSSLVSVNKVNHMSSASMLVHWVILIYMDCRRAAAKVCCQYISIGSV